MHFFTVVFDAQGLVRAVDNVIKFEISLFGPVIPELTGHTVQDSQTRQIW